MIYDTVIKDGMIFDGTRNPRYRADVGIKDGVIIKIGRLVATDARKVVDASGLHVAPGFIDLHTHYDSQLFWDPYCTISGWHGITSVVIGNCGFGFAPVRPEQRERTMLSMTRNEAVPLDAMKAGMPWDWVTVPEFLASVDRAPKAVNILPYVGLSPLLVWVLGLERAKAGVMPTEEEHEEMKQLLHEAMDAGACGWSVQRLGDEGNIQRDYDGTPMVTDLMHDETAIAMAEVLAERNDGFIQLSLAPRPDGSDQRHCEVLAEVSGRPVIWNALVALPNFGPLHRGPIAWLKSCTERGLRIYRAIHHHRLGGNLYF